jgi:hypothetical protein
MLQSYYAHLHQHPDSLLIKLLGSFRLEIQRPHKQRLHFFTMRNVFASPPHKPIHVRFDLKGSTYGRKARETELLQGVPVLKVQDFFDGVVFPDGRKLAPTFVHLTDKKNVLLKQLAVDAAYLRRHEIMDYSLLVGIHYSDMDERGNVRQTIDAPPAAALLDNNSNGEQQSNYGLKPQKETLIPRQLLCQASICISLRLIVVAPFASHSARFAATRIGWRHLE